MNKNFNITIIKAKRSWFDLDLIDFLKYKDLLFLLIRRDFVTSYKQTILGPIWVVLQALLGSAVFTVIFGKIANLSTDGHPMFLFYLSGMLGWQYFASVYGVGCNALQSNLMLFSKVYFPRLIPPVGQAIFAIFNFLIQLAVFFIAFVIYQKTTSSVVPLDLIGLIFIPLLLLQSIALGLGIGFIISALSVKYRDLSRVAGMATQFILYASPIIYPVSEIPEKYQSFMAWNPLVFIIESYRKILLGHSTASTLEFALPSVALTLVVFLTGLILYNKTQRTYVDYA
jgi:lipopolysaccharide transport system permease protein